MMQVLKVIVRVFLISFGLLCIAVGGFCTLIGADQGLETAWVAGIGIVSVFAGGALIRHIFNKWKQENSGGGQA